MKFVSITLLEETDIFSDKRFTIWTLVKSSKIEVENNSVGKLLYGHSSSLKSDIRILVK